MIISGLFIGINNTVTTQAVMTVAPVKRPVASASYGFIRFIGAGLAPYAAGRMAASFGVHVPFYVGAGAVVVGILILASGHRLLSAAERPREVSSIAERPREVAGAARREALPGEAAGPLAPRWILLAVDGSPGAAGVTARAAEVATARGAGIEVMHVRETDVIDTEAIDLEAPEEAERIVHQRLAQLTALGVTATGSLMASTGAHGDVGRLIVYRARQIQADLIVVGAPSATGMAATASDALATALIALEAPCDVLVVASGGQPASAHAGHESAGRPLAATAQPAIVAGQQLRA